MKQLKYFGLILLSSIFVLIQSCDNDDPVDDSFQLPSEVINKIIIDKNGVKWFATDKGIVSFDNEKWTTYSDDKDLSTGPIADLAFDAASGISKLWLASTVGLSAFEFETSSINFQNYTTKNSEILDDLVSAVAVDGLNVKYIATPKGLSIFKNDKWDEFYGRKSEEILAEFKTSGIGVASNGYIYASTLGGGVSRFKYTDAVSGATTLNFPWAWGLPSDSVFTVFIDGIAQWYGTHKGVGHHASENTKEDWTTFTKADGLVCDTVYAIAKDHSGDIWFGTHKGVSKLALSKDSTWTTYTVKDGLIADKINTIATDKDGSLWFGTDEGISQFSNNQWTKY
jgi:ligand-binding sensor domain-containing protein